MGLIWHPYSGEIKRFPKIHKKPTEFLVTEIFTEAKQEEHGYQLFDYVFSIMGACRIHNFKVITHNPELARAYCHLRGGCFGMRDLGRMIWGQMYLEGMPPRIVPDWCLEWPLKNVEVFI